MADGSHIENCFWLYLRAAFSDQHEIWSQEAESHADNNCHITRIAIFGNSRGRTAVILIVTLYPSRESSDFDEIWCARCAV